MGTSWVPSCYACNAAVRAPVVSRHTGEAFWCHGVHNCLEDCRVTLSPACSGQPVNRCDVCVCVCMRTGAEGPTRGRQEAGQGGDQKLSWQACQPHTTQVRTTVTCLRCPSRWCGDVGRGPALSMRLSSHAPDAWCVLARESPTPTPTPHHAVLTPSFLIPPGPQWRGLACLEAARGRLRGMAHSGARSLLRLPRVLSPGS